MELKQLIGKTANFYGIDGHRFKLKYADFILIFEAFEDENDGYRSMLDNVLVVEPKLNDIFSLNMNPVTVVVEHSTNLDGYKLVGIETGHVYLEIGTDSMGSYYPQFVFNYELWHGKKTI